MSKRETYYHEQLVDLFAERKIGRTAVDRLVHIGSEGVPTSEEKLLRVARFIFDELDAVEAFEQADRVFIGEQMTLEGTDLYNEQFRQRFQDLR